MELKFHGANWPGSCSLICSMELIGREQKGSVAAWRSCNVVGLNQRG